MYYDTMPQHTAKDNFINNQQNCNINLIINNPHTPKT